MTAVLVNAMLTVEMAAVVSATSATFQRPFLYAAAVPAVTLC